LTIVKYKLMEISNYNPLNILFHPNCFPLYLLSVLCKLNRFMTSAFIILKWSSQYFAIPTHYGISLSLLRMSKIDVHESITIFWFSLEATVIYISVVGLLQKIKLYKIR